MRDSPQHVTEVDHIPPKAVLQKALQKVQQDSQGNAELRRRNPKLHAMLMGTDTDSYAREMLCMNTLRQDHRAALTTGNSVESQRCRDQLIQTLLSGDAEKLLKKSFIVAHPISSKQLKQDTGLNPCGIKERRNKAFAETTKAYYLIGFSKLVDRYYKDYGIIDQNQKDSLLAWVEKERHLDVNTKEYKELLTAIKEDD